MKQPTEQCLKCMAYYQGEHRCDGFMKSLVDFHKGNQPKCNHISYSIAVDGKAVCKKCYKEQPREYDATPKGNERDYTNKQIPKESWIGKFYALYAEGRLKEKTPHNCVDYFKARNFISELLQQQKTEIEQLERKKALSEWCEDRQEWKRRIMKWVDIKKIPKNATAPLIDEDWLKGKNKIEVHNEVLEDLIKFLNK